MELTFNGTIKRVLALQTLHNKADGPRDRLAYTTAMRVELMKLVSDLDNSVLPMYQKAVASSAIQELESQ